MKKLISLLIILTFILLLSPAHSQNKQDDFSHALKLKKEYNFKKALDILETLLENNTDSLYRIKIYKEIAECENGLNMLQFGTNPTVISKIALEKDLFYLHYPFVPDSTFIIPPTKLTNGKHPLLSPIYYRNNNTEIYFSAMTDKGNWDIYVTKFIDQDNWSAPERLNSNINSPKDELFPYLSVDGNRLYFSSNGHFGMGGFDLYFSERDPITNDWNTPQNMGFPFSSPHDDLLLIHSPDLSYTIFSSTREHSSLDSITIYVLNYEPTPIKRAIDHTSAKEIALLNSPVKRDKEEIKPNTSERFLEPDVEEYRRFLIQSKSIQYIIDSLNTELKKSRHLYTTLSKQEDIMFLERKISEDELNILKYREELTIVNQNLQSLEMNFLTKGRLLPRNEEFFNSKATPEKKNEAKKIEVNYTTNNLGLFPSINILEPIELFDYTFDVKDLSEFAENMEIPKELVYRVQLFSVGNRSTNLATFRGLRPIFENRNASGRWIYYAGQFYTYQEAQQALNRVKRAGFPNAIIAAFNNGESINLRSARTLEQRVDQVASYQVKLSGYPSGIPDRVLDIIRSNTDRDIAKGVDNGKDIYFIGPFTNRAEAQNLLKLIEEIGGEQISIEEITRN